MKCPHCDGEIALTLEAVKPEPEEFPWPNLRDGEFMAKWVEYMAFRREMKWTVREAWERQALKKLNEWGSKLAIEGIDTAMSNGWQGIFKPTSSGSTTAPKKDSRATDWSKEKSAV